MTKLTRLFTEHGQSPWLDNLTRAYLRDGTLARYIADGVRGVTANPAIFARAIEGSEAYDEQFSAFIASGSSVADAYWDLVTADITGALGLLRPVYDDSGGCDGFASIEVAPEIADDTAATVAAARGLHERIAEPNLLVKIPATPAGVPAIRAMTAEGRASTSPSSSPWPATARSSRRTWPGWRLTTRPAATSALCTASRPSSSAASTPKSTAASNGPGPAMRGRCEARRP